MVAGIVLSGDNWLEKFKNEEKQIQDSVEEDKKKWDALREKYKQQGEMIFATVNDELIKVCQVFGNPSLEDNVDKPFAKNGMLRMPIKSGATLVSVSLTFTLHLTENGYMLDVHHTQYDHVKQTDSRFTHFIQPPVDRQKIQVEIAEFLKNRNFVLERLAEEEKASRRHVGY